MARVQFEGFKSLAHEPQLMATHHGHEHLLSRGIAKDKEQIGIHRGILRLKGGTGYIHLTDALMQAVLQMDETAGIILQCLAIGSRDAVGLIGAGNEIGIMALQELLIIRLCRLRGYELRLWRLLLARREQQECQGYEKKIAHKAISDG